MLHIKNRGFTLIELMIVLVIAGILAAVAFPAYQEHVRSGKRADAQQFMLSLAQLNQRYFADNRSYTSNVPDLATTPSSVSQHYSVSIAVDAGPPASFTISAVPQGSQASDKCGTLTVDNTGLRNHSSGTKCW